MRLFDEFFELQFSKDKMEVLLYWIKPIEEEQSLTKSLFLDYLKEKGIVFGIVDDVFDVVISHQKVKEPITIASGIPPHNGTDAYLHVPLLMEKDKKDQYNETIDFKQVLQIPSVNNGELIAEKINSTEGSPGKNIFGDEIPAKNGKDITLRAGNNTRIDESSCKIYATSDGQISLEKKTVHVYPIYQINGDITMQVGNIDFIGNVIINGNVPSGFQIKAKGDIRVKGTVEAAQLIADGSVYIMAGIVAQGQGVIQAGQDVHVMFANQANVQAGGDIHVTQAIMHSHVTAGGMIICEKGKGLIVGGIISAGKGLIAREVGNRMQTLTSIFIGKSKTTVLKNATLENIINQSKKDIENLEKLLNGFIDKENQQFPLSHKERIMKLRVRNSLIIKNQALHAAMEDLAESSENLDEENDGVIQITETIYPNVDITYGKYRRTTSVTYQRAKIALLEAEIQVLPLS